MAREFSGARLRAHRRLSRAALAELSGVSVFAIVNFECGIRGKDLRLGEMLALTAALRVPSYALIDDSVYTTVLCETG
jgi:transcriptional regulator with XRE-family HTH domain